MAYATDQIKTEQTDPFICSMCKIRGKTEEIIKNHILQVHLSEHFAEVDTTGGIQDSLSQIFKECSDQKTTQNGDLNRRIPQMELTTIPVGSVSNGSSMPSSHYNSNSTSMMSPVVSTNISNGHVPQMTTLSFSSTQQPTAFQNGNGLVSSHGSTLDYITLKGQNGEPMKIHNPTTITSPNGLPSNPVTYSVPLANINGVTEVQHTYQQAIHTDTSINGQEMMTKGESEPPQTNGITVNYGGGGGLDATQQVLQPMQSQNDSFSGSASDNINDFVCAKCTFRTEKIDQLENHLKDAHPASCVSFLCKHCNFKASNSRLFNIHLSVAHGNNTERSIVYKGAVATPNNSSSKGNFQITTSTVNGNGTANDITSEAMDTNTTSPNLNSIEPSLHLNGSSEMTAKERLKCEICETAIFSSTEALQEHKDQYHLGMRYQCFKCSSSFAEGPELQVHYLTKHEISSNEYKVSQVDAVRVKFVVDETNKKFSCDLCGMRFTTCSAMYKHKRAKHLGMEYKCHLCNYTNGYRRGLKSHYETKHKNEPYNIPRTTKGALLKKPDRKSNDKGMENCTAIISPAADSPEMVAQNKKLVSTSPITMNVNSSASPVALNISQSPKSNFTITTPSTPLSSSVVSLSIAQNNSGSSSANSPIQFVPTLNQTQQTSHPISVVNGGKVRQGIQTLPGLVNSDSIQQKQEVSNQMELANSNSKIMIIRQPTSNISTPTIAPQTTCISSTVNTVAQNGIQLVSHPIFEATTPILQPFDGNKIGSTTPACPQVSRPFVNTSRRSSDTPISANQTATPEITTPITTYLSKEIIHVDTKPTQLIEPTINGQQKVAGHYIDAAGKQMLLPSLPSLQQGITSHQQHIQPKISIATFPGCISTSISLPTEPTPLVSLPNEPSPLPEAITESVIDDGSFNTMVTPSEYGLQSLDNLKPFSPVMATLTSNSTVGETLENCVETNVEMKESELHLSTTKVDAHSQADWSQALALINEVPDAPFIAKTIGMTSDADQNKPISNDTSGEVSISNDDDGDKYSEGASSNLKVNASLSTKVTRMGNIEEDGASNIIVKMKESHNRFEAFLKKARHSKR